MLNFYPGFDYIRVIFCFAVVSLHTGLATQLELTHPSIFYFIRYHLEFLAVPMFLLLSLFLYISKRKSIAVPLVKQNGGVITSAKKFNTYFVSRFKYILFMYISWRAIHFVITQNFSYIKSGEHVLRALLGESTPTYFLLQLLILTVIIEFIFYKKSTEITTTKIILYSLFS
jgi:hypothetical protein